MQPGSSEIYLRNYTFSVEPRIKFEYSINSTQTRCMAKTLHKIDS